MFKRPMVGLLIAASALSTFAHAGNTPSYTNGDPAVITEWNRLAEGAIPASAGPTLPRAYAMMHIAMFDAVNSIEGGYTGYHVRISVPQAASSDVAAAQAARDV